MKLTNKTVPTSALRMSKFNWERDITEDDVADLAENIEEIGNLHPIIVRPIGKAGSMYEVLAGRRRLKAQRLLGIKKVEVRVVKCDDVRAEIISYSENLKIKKPDSREWSAGVKRLVDLFEKLHKVGTPPKPTKPTKSNGSKDGEFWDAASQNSGPGRPKEARAQAIKDAAKSVGSSEKSVRRAVKREEDLIPSASRALDQGKITQSQADILASMSVNGQRKQLSSMVRETREQTRQRRTMEKAQGLEDKTEIVAQMLTQIYFECKATKSKIDVVTGVMDGEELDYAKFTKLPHFTQVEEMRDALTDLLEIVEG
jgi:ParB family chromosome partitioning protein